MVCRCITGIILTLLCLIASAQRTRDTLSLSFRDLPLEIILDSITYKTGYYFSYNADAIPEGSLYTVHKNRVHLNDLLEYILTGTGMEFDYFGEQIILRAKKNTFEDKVNSKENSSQERTDIHGWVREFATKKPIEGVHVFLNGTTFGATTDHKGNYKINNVPVSSYLLVFSHVEYETVSYPLTIKDSRVHTVNGLLNFKIQRLNDIEIVSDPLVSEDDWPKYYRNFCREFLGTSSNAPRTRILNPEVLDFSYDEYKEVFKAEASEPLIIQNDALGYRIDYKLELFEKEGDITSFYGKSRFQNLPVENHRIEKRWRENRRKSYHGSILHFFKSLIADRLNEEGFKVYGLPTIYQIEYLTLSEIERSSLLKKNGDREWQLSFPNHLLIIYTRELESPQYQISSGQDPITINGITPSNPLKGQLPADQKSIIELRRAFITLDNNGQIKEPTGLLTMGYWSWERVADLMPVDFDPRSDNL